MYHNNQDEKRYIHGNAPHTHSNLTMASHGGVYVPEVTNVFNLFRFTGHADKYIIIPRAKMFIDQFKII
jgi:hypothetical protein